jgi:hypothetical protein
MALPEVDKPGGHFSSNRFCSFPFLDFTIPELERENFECERFYVIPWVKGPDGSEDNEVQGSVDSMLLQLIDLGTRTFRRIGWIMNEDPEKKGLIFRKEIAITLPSLYDSETSKHTVYII